MLTGRIFPKTMDYRELLKKYIEIMVIREGNSCIGDEAFSEEERKELRKIADELCKE
jgi:hypothetical protein